MFRPPNSKSNFPGRFADTSKPCLRTTFAISCSQIRLKTYVILLAATVMRAVEALSVRIKDFDSKSRKIILRGGFTKTRTERIIWLMEEASKQIEALIEYKYRSRRVCHYNARKHFAVNEYRTPAKNENDFCRSPDQTQSKEHIQ
jgi:integrase